MRLLALNRQLRSVGEHLSAVVADLTARLDAEIADPRNIMVDYEIMGQLDYQLREDDPGFVEDHDNFLASRTELLKRGFGVDVMDFAEPGLPAGLLAEPHCWLFHDLYDHGYGTESPQLSLKDCARIGKIFVDVQVWHQYVFDSQAT